jgi:hypothetical protein
MVAKMQGKKRNLFPLLLECKLGHIFTMESCTGLPQKTKNRTNLQSGDTMSEHIQRNINQDTKETLSCPSLVQHYS